MGSDEHESEAERLCFWLWSAGVAMFSAAAGTWLITEIVRYRTQETVAWLLAALGIAGMVAGYVIYRLQVIRK